MAETSNPDAGTVHELGIFSAYGGLGNLGTISEERLAKLTPDRKARFISLRTAQSLAAAARKKLDEARDAVMKTQRARDLLIAERNKHYPPQSRIEALREVQDATRRRSR